MVEAHVTSRQGSAPDAQRVARLSATLTQILGGDNVIADKAERVFYSQDIYKNGALVSLVVRPASTDEVSRTVAAATEAGFAVAPRGGGMSYTSGYIQDTPGAVLIDMGRMTRVIEINAEDMYVTVECGCTWSELHEVLKDTGLRTPFWGTLSGLRATVGGALSQNGIYFGSSQYGPAIESVIGLKVALADGRVVPTGTWATKGGKPFQRHYGPDLTGVFTADTGAFGVKCEATLRLIRTPTHEDAVSFAFDRFEDCADTLCEWARAGVACEIVGFDPNLAEMRLKRESLMKDLGTLKDIVTGKGTLLEGVKDAAKVALSGRRYMDEVAYSAHAVVEGYSKAAVAAGIAELRRIGAEHGREIANSIPTIIRAHPFTPLNAVLTPDGHRWAPIHGFLPLSGASAMWQAIYDLFDEYKAKREKHNITFGFLVGTVSTNSFLIEPVLFWPEERFTIHERTIEEHILKRLPTYAPNPDATAVVDEIKKRLCRLFLDHGASHLQIGRTYLYREGRDPEAWRLIEGLKDLVDPDRRMNPGSLGLD